MNVGSPASSLSISEKYVYALTSDGEVLVRYGITPVDVIGDYWKKIPGAFAALSGMVEKSKLFESNLSYHCILCLLNVTKSKGLLYAGKYMYSYIMCSDIVFWCQTIWSLAVPDSILLCI